MRTHAHFGGHLAPGGVPAVSVGRAHCEPGVPLSGCISGAFQFAIVLTQLPPALENGVLGPSPTPERRPLRDGPRERSLGVPCGAGRLSWTTGRGPRLGSRRTQEAEAGGSQVQSQPGRLGDSPSGAKIAGPGVAPREALGSPAGAAAWETVPLGHCGSWCRKTHPLSPVHRGARKGHKYGAVGAGVGEPMADGVESEAGSRSRSLQRGSCVSANKAPPQPAGTREAAAPTGGK